MGKLKQLYDKRYEQGLCIYCGKKPYSDGMKTCDLCRLKKKNNKKANKNPLVDSDGNMITALGETKSVDDVLNSSEFLMCGK